MHSALDIAFDRAATGVAISVDLVAASERSDTFPQDWSRERRARGLERYRRWIALKQEHPNSAMAPTREIDLFWHLHMLSPVAYHRDCVANFGRLLDHDGGFGKGPGELPILKKVFLRTARRFEARFGEPYADDGTWAADAAATNCWHDCQDRCWHACADGE